MNTLFVAVLACLVGVASSNVDTSKDTVKLTVEFSKSEVKFRCKGFRSNGDTRFENTDKWALTKKDVAPSASDFTALTAAQVTNQEATKTADAYKGEMVCHVQQANDATKRVTSEPVETLAVCSSAPRMVDSLGLALLCLMATALKSKY